MFANLEKFTNIVELFNHQVSKLKNKPYLWSKKEGKYSPISWEQTKNQVEAISKSLLNLGVLKGDRVAIISENRPEWQIADLAIMNIGAITVPAYTTSTQKDYEYILNHCEARCLIVSSELLAKKALPAATNSTKCKNVVMIDELIETITKFITNGLSVNMNLAMIAINPHRIHVKGILHIVCLRL